MPKSATVTLTELIEEPYASVVCYPRATPSEMAVRMEELQQLGVETIEFYGKASAYSLQVLGKGYVGIVAAAKVAGRRVALKMQRVDSGRESLLNEAELLKLANSVGVGPKFLDATKHFLVMELVDGGLLEEWLQTRTDPAEVRVVVADILEQCWRLDEICLDHGELSKAPKHLLLNARGKPFIVDFETASTVRNASNVTSVCQFLFMGHSEACVAIEKALGARDRVKMVAGLRRFRKSRDRQSFDELARLCLG